MRSKVDDSGYVFDACAVYSCSLLEVHVSTYRRIVKTSKEHCTSLGEEKPGGFPGINSQRNSSFKTYSLCKTTMTPISPSNTVFNQGCSDSNIVTYPTKGT